MSDNSSTPPALIRPADAAAYLAISTRQLLDLTTSGHIRYVNIGVRDRETRRYNLADLDAFIEDCRQPTRSDATSAVENAVRMSSAPDFEVKIMFPREWD
ncbi:helix-turn-helix domain-containing protein [Aureimonas sp. AU4]|uniref:helix-turn-helix domain-containing protein n=1 Tax=Aureimonas sp. AU4 TaxID=1638163 RepID=UPI00178CDB1B